MEFTQGVRFDSLGLTEEVQRALKKKNIEESTPVQAGCIPPMREWKDVIAKAPTGTGKTFAFDAAFKDVHPCIGCDKCVRTGECTFEADDMKELNRTFSRPTRSSSSRRHSACLRSPSRDSRP